MRRNALLLTAALLAGPALAGTAAHAQRAEKALERVEEVLGAKDLKSIAISGRAWTVRNGFRQTRTASPPWYPLNEIIDYERAIDFEAPASLATGRTYAENIFHEPPTWGAYTQNIPAGRTAWTDQLNIWLTPWGFVKGAEANGVTRSKADGQTVLSWTSPESQKSPSGKRYTVNAYIDDDDHIVRTETWVEDPFVGDLHVEARYSGYKTIDGVLVPGETEIWQAGGAVFGVAIEKADANPDDLAALLTPPPAPPGAGGPPPGGAPGAGGPPPSPASLVHQLAPGVWQIDGAYNSLVVEFENDLVVFESGQNDARGEAVLAAVKTISEKPIRGVVVSHPHSDHAGGLVPVVRAGIPLIVSEHAVDALRYQLSQPRTLLGQETLTPKFEVVPDDGPLVIEDSLNRLELHRVDNLHTDSNVIGYLPKHKIAIQADFTIRLGPDGKTAGPEGQTVLIRQLAEYVKAHDLKFDNLIAVHQSPNKFTSADVLKALP